MFICFTCKAHHKSSKLLFQHLRHSHALFPHKFLRLKCGQQNCNASFCTYRGFKKHLDNFHKLTASSETDIETIDIAEATHENAIHEEAIEEPSTSSAAFCSERSAQLENKSIVSMCGSVVAQLQASGAAESTVQMMVESMEAIVTDLHRHAKETILKSTSELKDTGFLKKIEEGFDELDNPFTDFNTQRKRQKFFEEKWELVEPVEYVLGVRFDVRKDKTTGVYCQVPITDKFVYVPILGTLKSLFKNSEICEAFLQPKQNEKGIYRDICDGSHFQSNALFSQKRHAIQIQLYYDDFETANPLGSKKGIHKLGCFYFILRNLPPKCNSVLTNIHVISLFYSQDLKKYGFDKILQPLIDDLKSLETEGIDVPFSDTPLLGSVVQVTGDNLGLHGLFGFVESFSATHFCRFCLISKDVSQSIFSEDHPGLIFRTREIHAQHCATLSENSLLVSTFGVKKSCLLNTLKFFHTSENYAVDIMHDLLEGVVQYELKLVFKHFIDQKLVSSDTLLQRIQSFNYGYNERKNRPSCLKIDDSSKDLGLNAIQSWCLVRNSPLILGDIVNRNDSYWNLLLLLIQIVNIVFSPVVTYGITYYLKHLIHNHHKLFKFLFPQKRLIPKHHFMLHYPRCIRKIGPLLHVWCMRFEAKHNFFKRSVKNFKNLTKSLVKQHQRQLAYYWENFNFERFEFGPLKSVVINGLEGGDAVCSTFDMRSSVEVTTTNWVKSYGTEYHIGMLVCTKKDVDLPIFNRIVSIIIKDNQAFLLMCKVETLYFDEHFNAYCVKDSGDSYSVQCIGDLMYYRPYDKQFSNEMDEKTYVVPYCHIV